MTPDELAAPILERLETDDHTVETIEPYLESDAGVPPREAIWTALARLFADGRVEAFDWDAASSALRPVDRLDSARASSTWFRLVRDDAPRPNLAFVRGWKRLATPLDEMLDELYDGDVWFGLVEVRFGDASIVLVLNRYAYMAADQRWELRCRGCVGHRFVDDGAFELEIAHEHVLLSTHLEPSVEIFFRGRAANAREPIGELHERHVRRAGEWIPFGQFLNANLELRSLLEGGFGRLADAPKSFALEYAAVLREAGFAVDLLEREAKPRAEPLLVLELGRSYVVCAGVEAKRLDP
jgi:hypothetical protein